MPCTETDAPTISELIEQLEEIKDEHGDLPVVYLEEIWHVYPTPEVTDGREYGVTDGDEYIDSKRVEL